VDLVNEARTVGPRTTKFDRTAHVGEKRISRGSATPLPQGGGAPALPNFGGSLSYTICRRTTKFDVVTCGGEACILGSATPPIPRQQSSIPPFWARRDSIEPNSYGNVAGWLGGWVAGCLSHPVLYQND